MPPLAWAFTELRSEPISKSVINLGGGKRVRAACGGYICFEDEASPADRPGDAPGAGAATPRR